MASDDQGGSPAQGRGGIRAIVCAARFALLFRNKY
jgi:hypothetical protein